MRALKILTALALCFLLTGCVEIVFEPIPPAPVTGDGMQVHFLDVGQADCALLECDGKYILIDGGNIGDSNLVVSYLEQQGVQELEAVICSHAHEDHVGGLPGVLAVYPTQAVYAPTRTYASDCFDDFVYYADQQGLQITIPSVGDQITFGEATAEVLGPVKTYAETNNTSLVLKVTYGTTDFLFTGDMETDAEADLLDSGADIQAEVLKVGHHGSDTSTSYRFLYEVAPEHCVISVGEDNKYDHPSRQTLSRLRDADAVIYRTDRLGTVIARTDGRQIEFLWNSDAQPQMPDIDHQIYIGNTKSKKLHTEGCSALPEKDNRIEFSSLQEALNAGYILCSRCME